MSRIATVSRVAAAAVSLLTVGVLSAQSTPDWRRIGNAAIGLPLAGIATGPVERVWYSSDGASLFCRTVFGQTFSTADGESWQRVFVATPPVVDAAGKAPEDGAHLRESAARLYAFGRDAWRSDDGGANWTNLTSFRRQSILGDGLYDMAVSPRDAEEITVAGRTGIWRSLDGGLTWHGLNDALPNLPVRRIAALPSESGGLRLAIEDPASPQLEWSPGEKQSWKPVKSNGTEDLRLRLTAQLGVTISAAASAGRYIYAGSIDGRLWISEDAGRTWRDPSTQGGAVMALWVDPAEPRSALAALDRVAASPRSPKVLRTINGGIYWDDLTSDLPDAGVSGITAERSSGAVYVATELGVFLTVANLTAAGSATPWTKLSGLPTAAARDVRLDAAGNQLYAAIAGYGIYIALAPHRSRDLRVVNAADFSERPAAPGSLLSVLGGRVSQATAGSLRFPLLDASDKESQLQVPFEAEGSSLSLTLEAGQRRVTLGLALTPVSPAIFVDRDGSPMILDGESGVLLDGRTAARAGSRLQILATGLGRVRPDWPSGLPAPLDDAPVVVAPVRVLLDGVPVEVLRAALAPSYVGFYVVEVRLPDIVNAGSAGLVIEAGGRQSNHVRVQLEN